MAVKKDHTKAILDKQRRMLNSFIDNNSLCTVDEYKAYLDQNNIMSVCIHFETTSGKTVNIVMPQNEFKALSTAKVNKLFKDMKK